MKKFISVAATLMLISVSSTAFAAATSIGGTDFNDWTDTTNYYGQDASYTDSSIASEETYSGALDVKNLTGGANNKNGYYRVENAGARVRGYERAADDYALEFTAKYFTFTKNEASQTATNGVFDFAFSVTGNKSPYYVMNADIMFEDFNAQRTFAVRPFNSYKVSNTLFTVDTTGKVTSLYSNRAEDVFTFQTDKWYTLEVAYKPSGIGAYPFYTVEIKDADTKEVLFQYTYNLSKLSVGSNTSWTDSNINPMFTITQGNLSSGSTTMYIDNLNGYYDEAYTFAKRSISVDTKLAHSIDDIKGKTASVELAWINSPVKQENAGIYLASYSSTGALLQVDMPETVSVNNGTETYFTASIPETAASVKLLVWDLANNGISPVYEALVID